LIKVLRHLLDVPGDPWVKAWTTYILKDIGVIMNYKRKHVLVMAKADRAVKFVIKVLHHTELWVPSPSPGSDSSSSPM